MTDGIASRLERIASDYPLSLHAVGLSLGSMGGPDPQHLQRLKELVTRYQPLLVSDHLSWSAVDDIRQTCCHYLITSKRWASLSTASTRSRRLLKRQVLVENPSKYLCLPHSMSEAEFLAEIVHRSGCGVLLDVNNIYVSAVNCGADPHLQLLGYLEKI